MRPTVINTGREGPGCAEDGLHSPSPQQKAGVEQSCCLLGLHEVVGCVMGIDEEDGAGVSC